MSSGAAEAAEILSGKMRGRVRTGVVLARYTSFRLGGPAALMIEPEDPEDLAAAAAVLAGLRMEPLVVGRGSNLLVSDSGWPGVAIRLGSGFEKIGGEGTSVEAGAAVALPRLANHAARRSLTGLEFAVAIPATAGGAVRMNAGAHGAQMSDVVSSVSVVSLSEGAASVVPAADAGFGYRTSRFGPADVVTAVRLSLGEGSRPEILRRMEDNRAHRSATQPSEAPNAGSMFTNPSGGSAGALIEAAGLKGMRSGGAEVSHKHANFFLARPGARAQDVYDLMAAVQAAVVESSGVLLAPEVRLKGSFDTSAGLRWPGGEGGPDR